MFLAEDLVARGAAHALWELACGWCAVSLSLPRSIPPYPKHGEPAEVVRKLALLDRSRRGDPVKKTKQAPPAMPQSNLFTISDTLSTAPSPIRAAHVSKRVCAPAAESPARRNAGGDSPWASCRRILGHRCHTPTPIRRLALPGWRLRINNAISSQSLRTDIVASTKEIVRKQSIR